jgi:hypothetical protein
VCEVVHIHVLHASDKFKIVASWRNLSTVHHARILRCPIAAIILVGLGLKLFVFSAPEADASVVESFSLDISKMQENSNLATQKIHDMTFIYSDGD